MKKAINSENLSAAIGPYSHCVAVGNLIFTSGQLGVTIDGDFAGTTIEEQTEQALKNLKSLLETAGTSMDKVIKTVVFLSDLSNFAAMNNVYARYFGGGYPARSCVEVARLPKDALVEIEVVAVK